MKQLLRITLLTAVAAMAAMPAWADAGTSALPKKMSGYDGWHGARIEKKTCRLILPRDFGRAPADLKLLQEMVRHGYNVDFDLECPEIMIPYAALDQIKRLAVEDQNRAAAELIVFEEEKGNFGLDGELAETFGGSYLFPVVLGYNKVAEIVPPKNEAKLATYLCTAYYNPSSGDLDLEGLKARLTAQKMQSFVRNIDRECARIEKEVNGFAGPQ